MTQANYLKAARRKFQELKKDMIADPMEQVQAIMTYLNLACAGPEHLYEDETKSRDAVRKEIGNLAVCGLEWQLSEGFIMPDVYKAAHERLIDLWLLKPPPLVELPRKEYVPFVRTGNTVKPNAVYQIRAMAEYRLVRKIYGKASGAAPKG